MSGTFDVQLKQIIGEAAYTADPVELLEYGRDWTRFATPRPRGVAFPKNAADVARVLKLCSEHQVAVVPSGGRTGLAGGAVATNGELVVSLKRMTRIEDVDTLTRTVRVEAGAVNQAVQDHCAPQNLFWPVELGSKGSCQVGGNLATNAGGIRVIRYGHARQWVLSLQVATVGGQLLELNGDLFKNNTGYDLRHLIIGSEGTLAVITAATLRLAPKPQGKRTLFFGLTGMPAVLELLRHANEAQLPLLAFECFTDPCVRAVEETGRFRSPFEEPSPFYVLMDVERTPGADERLDAWIEKIFAQSRGIRDGVEAQGPTDATKFWSCREGITESLALRGTVYKNDVALPLRRLDEFTTRLLRDAPTWYPNCELYFFGHIGDGNLHVNVVKPKAMDAGAFLTLCEQRNEDLFALVQSLQGSIAAEHGVGLLKKRFLHYSRTEEEIRCFRAIKQFWDPRGILNPGKIFEVSPGGV